MAKLIFQDTLQDILLEASSSLGKIAAPLYGPSGKSVLFEPKYDIPMVAGNVKDLLDDFTLSTSEQSLVVSILCNAALQLSKSNGSGTGTMLVLTQALLSSGNRLIASGADPMSFRKGAMMAAEAAMKAMYDAAAPIQSHQDLSCVLHTASPDTDTVDILNDAFSRVGFEGIITIEDSQFAATSIDSGGILYC